MKHMRLGIDASNIRSGGGITHLTKMLRASDPLSHGVEKVVVWAPRATLANLEDKPWLLKRHEPTLEANYFQRALWQRNGLGREARAERCDVLFAPGGSFATDFRPIVTMSQNLLPFEWKELRRYGVSRTAIRLTLLRWIQGRSFRHATGVVFLTRYAHEAVCKVTGPLAGGVSVIPHGVDRELFYSEPAYRSLSECSLDSPFRIVYVSIVDLYKHQWQVVEAVARLRRQGMPVALELIGPAYPAALRRLRRAMRRQDPNGAFVQYLGEMQHGDLPERYRRADLCVFASSCENMPNILLEAMASAIPIACSERGPMPEVLGDAGVYFDPEDPVSIARALGELIGSPDLRRRNGVAAGSRAWKYSWRRCADDTFRFLRQISLNGGT